jgi:steroid delta-isomerase-like uncharacterized protein
MSAEENKELVSYSVKAQMNLEAVVQFFFVPDMIDQSGHGARSLADVFQEVELLAGAFPDWHATIEDLIAQGDKVVMRGVARGTHRGTFMGIPPTGKKVTVTGMHVFRIADGKIVEHWAEADYLGVNAAIGRGPDAGRGRS